MTDLDLIARAKKFSNRVAFTDGNNDTTYAELLEKSEAVAASLLDGTDDLGEARIAFAAPIGADYAIIQWGIWRAGGIAVPLNIDASLPEMQHCLDCASVSKLIALSSTAVKITPLCDENAIPILMLENITNQRAKSLPNIDPSRRAMIIFTSGTTNKPKGVVTSHANIEAQVVTLVDFWRWQQDDIIPLFLPMHHVHGIINVMSCALYSGAKLDSYPRGFDMDRMLGKVSAGSYTLFMAVPTIYVKLIQAIGNLSEEDHRAACRGFNQMRLMISGSAALPVKIHEKWQALTGQILLERYGMTEIGMALSNPLDGERRPGAVGIALPGVDIQLVSEDGKVVTEEEVPGEIQVRGDNVFLEYWQNEKATQESFKDGWFVTGDMAVLESGYYRIMGRLSIDIIKSGGYKLSALEIENYLLGHDDINEVAVIGLMDDTWGEVVAAAVVLKENASMTLEQLQAWSRDKMSNYKIARHLLIVDSLPRNAMGKVTKSDVKALFK